MYRINPGEVDSTGRLHCDFSDQPAPFSGASIVSPSCSLLLFGRMFASNTYRASQNHTILQVSRGQMDRQKDWKRCCLCFWMSPPKPRAVNWLNCP